ncbi:hypothetical protein BP5796_09054 [Coleophoma crateriformis]|uniref:XPG-I domain-containing protein n=1 Tax=Coleophoma crateriformis TaxID=565419 RepID=A0A3D8R2Y6_9HELO|nr:hypothetical protein BP5796_09054 [Coleophoma crateriformis]
MGIPGIYGEIGPGERVSLQKLAIDKFEQSGRPLRIAIDISIWQFQIQSGRGGTNPAIRTLYYRLLRLLSISVQPLFVFDGPHRPAVKRNKRVGANGGMLSNMMTKQVLKLFGFPYHTAPGEAEAECALLQREGIVDAVLSEDVDTLMFGCSWTFRNWSSEGRGNKSPTHVSVYESEATKRGVSGLDREGMILVALMSGGDYDTDGIPGCGIKVACEAARAGFGRSLCRISRSDLAALDAWRQNLMHELETNESKFFRSKHKSIKIPQDFPDKEILGLYTHPVVSTASKIVRLREEILWDEPVDVQSLREWVAESFGWRYKSGAKKFIRGLAPGLLTLKLRLRGDRRSSGYGDLVFTAMQEMELVRAISGKRTHFDTGGIPELRIVFHPNDIVGIDLDAEAEAEPDHSADYGRDGLAPHLEDDTIEPYISDEDISGTRSASPSKRAESQYDPTQLDRMWAPRSIALVGVPLKVEDYEESQRDPKLFLKQRATERRLAKKRGDMPKGAMDKFVKVTKSVDVNTTTISKEPRKPAPSSSQSELPPVYLAPSLTSFSDSQPESNITNGPTRKSTRLKAAPAKVAAPPNCTLTKTEGNTKSRVAVKPKTVQNPWTMGQKIQSNSNPRITKNQLQQNAKSGSGSVDSSIISLLSSPPAPLPRKHTRLPEDKAEEDFNTYQQNSPEATKHSSVGAGDADDQPSPRKKRSPNIKRVDSSKFGSSGALTPQPVNRTLEFPSISGDKPASHGLQTLISKPDSAGVEDIVTLSSSPEQAKTPKPPQTSRRPKTTKAKADAKTGDKTNKKKLIVLRESLPGAWKEVDAEDLEGHKPRGRSWRVSQVEVLDLTES